MGHKRLHWFVSLAFVSLATAQQDKTEIETCETKLPSPNSFSTSIQQPMHGFYSRIKQIECIHNATKSETWLNLIFHIEDNAKCQKCKEKVLSRKQRQAENNISRSTSSVLVMTKQGNKWFFESCGRFYVKGGHARNQTKTSRPKKQPK